MPRPKLYLLLTVTAVLFELVLLFGLAPPGCWRCKAPLDRKGEPAVCSKCLELLRAELEAPCVRCRKTIVARGALSEFCSACTEDVARRLGLSEDAAKAAAFGSPLASSYTPPYPENAANPHVKLVTDRGDVVVELFPTEAPRSVASFLAYARAGSLDDVIFHRVESYLVVTGGYRGGYDGAALVPVPALPPVPSESRNGLRHRAGTVGLPRQDADPDSATSHFFVNLIENPHYNPTGAGQKEAGYTVFGQVVRGFEVLDALRLVPVAGSAAPPGFERMPRRAIRVQKVVELEGLHARKAIDLETTPAEPAAVASPARAGEGAR